jgi:hypothetical protein
MSKYLITLEVTTDTNPEYWEFDNFINLDEGEDYSVESIKKVEDNA